MDIFDLVTNEKELKTDNIRRYRMINLKAEASC